jgi:hypothetical protein
MPFGDNTSEGGSLPALEKRVAVLEARVRTDESTIASLQALLNGISRGPDAYGYDTLTPSAMNVKVVNGTGAEQSAMAWATSSSATPTTCSACRGRVRTTWSRATTTAGRRGAA